MPMFKVKQRSILSYVYCLYTYMYVYATFEYIYIDVLRSLEE